MSPPNSYAEALTSNEMVLGDGAFGRWLGLDDVMWMKPRWWDSAPYMKRLELSFSVSCEDTARRQQSASQEERSHQTLAMLIPCRTLGDKCLLFKPLSLWYFVTVAGVKTMSISVSFACVCVCMHMCADPGPLGDWVLSRFTFLLCMTLWFLEETLAVAE